MKKITIILCAAFLLVSCSKPQQSPDFLYGSKLYEKFVNYYLKGEARLAEHAFAGAEAQFLQVDSMCNLSRLYIGRYVLDEGGNEQNILKKSAEYAKLGGCEAENAVILYLSGEKYDRTLLPEPYRSSAGADAGKLASLSEDKDFPDYTRTRLLRRAAIDYIVGNPEKSEELANSALVMDKFNGWSLNILRDLIIIKTSREKQSKENEDIIKRIELIKTVLNKK